MAYIKFKEKLFSSSQYGTFNQDTGSLKTYSSCTDPRAWSSDPDDNRDYISDSFYNNASNNNNPIVGSIVPTNIVIDLLINAPDGSQTFTTIDETEKEKETGEPEKQILEEKLAQADEKIKHLTNENENLQRKLEGIHIKSEELINLKNLVKDLSEKVINLENVKNENLTLRAELTSDARQQLAESQAENNHLAAELEACQEMVQKFETLRRVNEEIKHECKDLKIHLATVKNENGQLKVRLKEEIDKMEKNKTRTNALTTAIADREILIGKLSVKEEKINFLTGLVEDQERQVKELTWQLQKLTQNSSTKEERLTEKVEEMKKLNEIKTVQLIEFETKLEVSETLVTELQILRNQFRLTNSSLTEHVDFYKKKFQTVALFGMQMMHAMKHLKIELDKKKLEIERLSAFPELGKTVVYFAQLNGLLSDDGLLRDANPEKLRELITNLRLIVSKLKVDNWGKRELLPPIDIRDKQSQTILAIQDNGTQFEFFYCSHEYVQTDYPDEYVIRYEKMLEASARLSSQITTLQNATINEQRKAQSVESKLIDCLEEKALRESTIESQKNQIELLNNNIVTLNCSVKDRNDLLQSVIDEIDKEMSEKDSISEIFEESMDNTLRECALHITVLEAYIGLREKEISFLNDFIENELRDTSKQTELLERELEFQNTSLRSEKNKNAKLVKQMMCLEKELLEKDNNLDMLKVKLEALNNFFLDLESMIFSLESSKGFGDEKIIVRRDCEIMALDQGKQFERVTQLVKYHNEMLKENLQTEKDLRDKLKAGISTTKVLKKVIRNNKIQNRDLKRRAEQLNANVKRVRKCLKNIQKALGMSKSNNEQLKTENNNLLGEIDALKVENGYLVKDIENLRLKISNLEFNLEVKDMKTNEFVDEKEKMGKALTRVTKRLERYKQRCEKEMLEKGTETDNFDNEINCLEIKNRELFAKNLELLAVIDNLKACIVQSAIEKEKTEPEKIELTSEGIQVELFDWEEKLNEELSQIKKKHEDEIALLSKKYAKEKEQMNKNHLKNLNILKESYERDMKRLKKTHCESLEKIQVHHQEELEYLKEMKEVCNHENEFASLEEEHKEKLENLEKEYKDKLLRQEEEFTHQKTLMQEELDRRLLEKTNECQDSRKKMIASIDRLKQKCREYIKNSHEKHRLSILNFKEEFSKNFATTRLEEIRTNKKNSLTFSKVESIDIIPDIGKDTSEKPTPDIKHELQRSEAEDNIILEKVDFTKSEFEINIKKPISSTHILYQGPGSEYDKTLQLIPTKPSSKVSEHYICDETLMNPIFWDKNVFSSRIMELENELSMRNKETEKAVYTLQRRVREEQARREELESLLTSEMKHGIEVQIRLGIEFERAEQLLIEKEAMRRQLNTLEKKIQHYSECAETERATAYALKLELEKVLAQQNNVQKLEGSLLRLRSKLEKAVECEKRLTQELEKEKNFRKTTEATIRINKVTESLGEHKPNAHPVDDPSLKVIFIQQCGILHTWSRQVIKERNEVPVTWDGSK